MRDILEIIAGVAMVLAGLALATGLTDSVFPQLPIGLGLAAVPGVFGLLLTIDGLLGRRVRLAHDHRAALRTARLAARAMASLAFLALISPALAGALNLISVHGFPLAYYVAAQGSLIAFGLLALAVARKQNAIDNDHLAETGEQGGT
jgi:putative solute:sodium symporter small subunit